MTTRENQIDIARRLIATGISKDLEEVLKKQFPELAESEDERVRKRLIKFFQEKKNCVGDTWAGMNVDDALAYLEKQKEQKPAEWSEEDENALNMLHELISFGYIEKFFDAQTAGDMREWLNTRIKSLRPQPHYKPSEEQMEELLNVLTPGKDFDCDILAELYEQLKTIQSTDNIHQK